MAVERVNSKRESVAVVGLNDFRRQLARVLQEGGSDGADMLKEANWKVAQLVVEKAQEKAGTLGRMQAKAASALKPSRIATKAQVVGTQDARVPFFFGAEFGARQDILRRPRQAAGWAGPGRYRGFRQFLPWRGNKGDVGYFLFPAMREHSNEIKEMYGDEIDKIVRAVFPEES